MHFGSEVWFHSCSVFEEASNHLHETNGVYTDNDEVCDAVGTGTWLAMNGPHQSSPTTQSFHKVSW